MSRSLSSARMDGGGMNVTCLPWADLQVFSNDMLNGNFQNASGDPDVIPATGCFQPSFTKVTIAVAVVDLLLALAAIVGNVLVIYAVVRYRRLHNVTNVFILGLAASDLLVGLNVPYYVLFYFKPPFCHRNGCLLRYWFTTYASGCSMLCLVGVAVDRYIAILHPLSYPRVVRARAASLYVLMVWISMGVVSSLPLLGWGDRFDPTRECDLYYTHTMAYALGAVASVVLATFAVTTTLYAAIFKAAWRHQRAVVDFHHQVRQETRTARMMALVMGVHFLGFLPYLTVITLRYLDGVDQEELGAIKPFTVAAYFGKSAINPFIYGWKNKDFRVAFRKTVKIGD